MDPEDRFSKPTTTGKIRVSHGGRNRAKPYSRKKVQQSEESDLSTERDKGFLGKVASYVVPKWISSWFSSNPQTIEEESSESSEDDDEDEEKGQVTKSSQPNVLSSNHVSQNKVVRDMTSTPMVRNVPSFSIVSSDITDPQPGPSRQEVVVGVEKEANAKRLLPSLNDDEDSDDNDDGPCSPAKQERFERSNTQLNPFQFSMGARPTGPPQKFFTSKNKPSFKVSSFISSSPLIPHGSSSSTFYEGRTAFGGASAMQGRKVKRQRVSPVALNAQTRKTSIKAKSLSTSKLGMVTSDTARKILGALEKMSSPVRDASKLPGSPSSVLFNQSKKKTGLLSSSSASRFGMSANRPPVGALITPQNVRLQQTERQNDIVRPVFRDIRPVSNFKIASLPTSFSPEDDFKTGGGKMKQQRKSSHFPAVKQSEEEEPINTLPEIRSAAPLVLSSLPKFSFGSTVVSTASKAVSNVPGILSKNSGSDQTQSFQFSQPDKKSEEKIQIKGNAVSFQFTMPVVKETKANKTEIKASFGKKEEQISSESETVSVVENTRSNTSMNSDASKSVPKVSNIWGKKPNSWECETCLLVNSNETANCIACNAAKPSKKNVASVKQGNAVDLKSKFKPPEGSWECSQCMLMNKAGTDTCIACTAPKPSDVKDTEKPKNESFALKFKVDEGSWECDTCMLTNKPDSQECIACTAKRPGSKVTLTEQSSNSKKASPDKVALLKAKFAPKESTWECEACMVPNKADATECVCCAAPKPGSAPIAKSPASSISSGANSTSVAASSGAFVLSEGFSFASSGTSGFTFGSKNVSDDSKAGTDDKKGFSFGNNSSSSGFNFGSSGKPSLFGVGPSDGKGFVFGKKESSDSGFIFGGPKAIKEKVPIKKESSTKTEENNNLSNQSSAKPIFGTSGPTKMSESEKKPGGIKSIADAAQAGLLRIPVVPEASAQSIDLTKDDTDEKIDKSKTSFAWNGPIVNDINESKTIVFNTTPPPKNKTEESAKLEKPMSNESPFSFGTKGQKKETSLFAGSSVGLPAGGFNFEPSSNQEGKSTGKTLSFSSPSLNQEHQSSNTGFNFATPSLNQEQKMSSTGFNFASPALNQEPKTSSTGFNFASPVLNQEPKTSSTGFNFASPVLNQEPKTSSTGFNFAPPSLNQEQKSNNAGFSFSSGNLFSLKSTDASKAETQTGITSQDNPKSNFGKENQIINQFELPTKLAFVQNSGKQNIPSLFGNPQSNIANQSDSLLNATEPKTDIKVNSLSSGQSLFGNVEKSTGNLFSGSSSNPFSFGANSNTKSDSPFVFGNQVEQKSEKVSQSAGFSFTSPPGSNSILFNTIAPDSNENKPKPLSFTDTSTSNQNSSFKFGNAEISTTMFTADAPASSVPTGGFSFTGPPGTSGFSFTGNGKTNPMPMFSSGGGSPAPTNRVIKRAVRRKK